MLLLDGDGRQQVDEATNDLTHTVPAAAGGQITEGDHDQNADTEFPHHLDLPPGVSLGHALCVLLRGDDGFVFDPSKTNVR